MVTTDLSNSWLREGQPGHPYLDNNDPRDRSVSLDTRWDVVCPTTPFWNKGGISMDKEEPRELELSLLALLDPVTDISSEGLLVLLPK